MLYLTDPQAMELISMDQAIEQVEQAFAARAAGRAFDVPRERTHLPGANLNIMQAASLDLGLLGFKAYYIGPDDHTSLIQLIDRSSGRLEAIVEARWIGQLRTGATTALAAKYLARKDSGVVGMFGAGRQAGTQLEAICRVREVREVKVYSRDSAKLMKFCETMSVRLGVSVRPALSAEETVRSSDILITITRGVESVLDARWLEPGQFVACVGVNSLDRHEVDVATVARADLLVVDSREVARKESGDLLPALEAGLVHWETIAELAEVVSGRHPGRTDATQIVMFQSHGMALQDLYCGAFVLRAAQARGTGTQWPMASHRTG